MRDSILGSPLVMLFIILLIVVFPVFRIIKRTGHSGWWTLVMFFPLLNLVGLWLLAFSRWPALDSIQKPNFGGVR
jgi:hypothetical protein